MKIVSLVLGLILSVSAFANNNALPDYPNGILITDTTEKQAYLEALKLELTQQGRHNCKTAPNWNVTSYILNIANESELYKFDDYEPLFIIRMYLDRSDVDVFDILFHTNVDMTKVTKVERIDYKLTQKRVNVGTLAKPTIIDRKVAKILRRNICL